MKRTTSAIAQALHLNPTIARSPNISRNINAIDCMQFTRSVLYGLGNVQSIIRNYSFLQRLDITQVPQNARFSLDRLKVLAYGLYVGNQLSDKAVDLTNYRSFQTGNTELDWWLYENRNQIKESADLIRTQMQNT